MKLEQGALRSIMAATVLVVVWSGVVAAEEAKEPEAAVEAFSVAGFEITEEVVVPGTPEFVYDHLSGDVLPWWDHHVSEEPLALYIEARVGGKFIEVFNAEGDGVEHGRVTFAHRGRRLTFEGPLGLHGKAINLVCNYYLEPVTGDGDSTRIKLEVNGWGDARQDGLKDIIARVWHHFLVEQFVPYITERAEASH
jgi:hypothetical protein